MNTPDSKQRTGSNFDDFLAEEDVLDEVTARAYKRLWDLPRRVQDAIAEAHLSKTELAPDACRPAVPSSTACWTLKTRPSHSIRWSGWRAIGKQLVLRLA
jgi:hypothetical protein